MACKRNITPTSEPRAWSLILTSLLVLSCGDGMTVLVSSSSGRRAACDGTAALAPTRPSRYDSAANPAPWVMERYATVIMLVAFLST